MRYSDDNEALVGDIIQIDLACRGIVVACMDRGDYLPTYEGWACLREGIMVDTDFGGLVHYTSAAADELVLLERAANT